MSRLGLILGILGCIALAGCKEAPQKEDAPNVVSWKGQCFENSDCSDEFVCINGLCRISEAIDAPTYHRDIAPMMDVFCGGCHSGNGIGAFPFTTYEEVVDTAGLILDEIERGEMPPWRAGADCNTYINNPTLREAELATFRNWVERGVPEGDPSEAVAVPTTLDIRIPRVDFQDSIPEDYKPIPPGYWPETYRCHTFEWPYEEPKFITGFRGDPGDDGIVHHIVYFVSPPGERADFYRDLQDEDDEPGFECHGGLMFNDLEAQWIGTWTPGKMGEMGRYPEDVGVLVEPGSVVTALVHYDLSGSGDASRVGYNVTLEDEVSRVGMVVPWLDLDWINSASMEIPVGESAVVHSHSGDLWGLAEDREVLIHGAALHMHSRGVEASLLVERANGEEECVLLIPEWSEDWQVQHVLEKPVRFGPGDNLNISCTFDNTSNDIIFPGLPLKDVNWGILVWMKCVSVYSTSRLLSRKVSALLSLCSC